MSPSQLRSVEVVGLIRLFSYLPIIGFLLSSSAFAGVKINHVNIVVSDLDKAARFFSSQGFTLKKPHIYKKGLRKGLITQAIRFQDRSYLQLIAPSTLKEGKEGALTEWYQDQLKNGEGAVSFVIEKNKLKELQKVFKKNKIDSSFQQYPRYQWLSFKTGSPYQYLAFINETNPPNISALLTGHQNKTTGIYGLSFAPPGEPAIWAKLMTLATARDLSLNFESHHYNSPPIKEVLISGLAKKFSWGRTIFRSPAL